MRDEHKTHGFCCTKKKTMEAGSPTGSYSLYNTSVKVNENVQ